MSERMHFPVVIIGAGATGLTAALAVADAGVAPLVLERDATPLGSTAMSTGLIPAAGTPDQAAAGIVDDASRFAADIVRKTKGATDAAIVDRLAHQSAETIAWLRDRHGVPLTLVEGFLYPGHSARRMYGTPNRSGSELIAALEAAVVQAEVTVLTRATATALVTQHEIVTGVVVERPDGSVETIGCDLLVLATSGFAGNAALVAQWIPEMAGAALHCHPGNKGDALRWGMELGALTADLDAYQGHGGLAAGHGIPILWPLIMEGGFQVNVDGRRFSNEAAGYSEQAARVNAQPGHVAWSVFDARLHRLMLDFSDYRDALGAGAIVERETIGTLADATGLPAANLAETIDTVARCVAGAVDPFGRDFTGKPVLAAPWYAAKVTGALFHTQGGLVVDRDARVCRRGGGVLPNLFAGGGAARGISGSGADGYMAGNGLLTATTFGKLAGRAAAAQFKAARRAREV